MRGAGEHGEPGHRESGEIAHHVASEQPEHLYCVLGAGAFGIPDDEQGGRLDRPDVLGRPG